VKLIWKIPAAKSRAAAAKRIGVWPEPNRLLISTGRGGEAKGAALIWPSGIDGFAGPRPDTYRTTVEPAAAGFDGEFGVIDSLTCRSVD